MKIKNKNLLRRVLALIGAIFTIITATILPTFAYSMEKPSGGVVASDLTLINLATRFSDLPFFADGARDIYRGFKINCKSDKVNSLVFDFIPVENGNDKVYFSYFHEIEILLFARSYSTSGIAHGASFEIFICLDGVWFLNIDIDKYHGSPSGDVRCYNFTVRCLDSNNSLYDEGVIDWGSSSKQFQMQLYIDPLADWDVSLYNQDLFMGNDNYFDSPSGILSYCFTSVQITQPKSYSEGYSNGYFVGESDGYKSGLSVGELNGYDQGYQAGEKNANETMYNNGHEVGYTEGYGVGYTEGEVEGTEKGYQIGLKDGFNAADTSQAWSNMKNLIFAIFDAPFYVISISLNFDLFGINIAGTLIALITLAIVVWILKIVVVKIF